MIMWCVQPLQGMVSAIPHLSDHSVPATCILVVYDEIYLSLLSLIPKHHGRLILMHI
jgi:hypothetical protein